MIVFTSPSMITKKKISAKVVIEFSVRELHNRMLIPSEEGGIKEARYSENNIIIGDLTLRNVLPPQIINVNS